MYPWPINHTAVLQSKAEGHAIGEILELVNWRYSQGCEQTAQLQKLLAAGERTLVLRVLRVEAARSPQLEREAE